VENTVKLCAKPCAVFATKALTIANLKNYQPNAPKKSPFGEN
jgi:hypothetical protein